MTTLIDSNGADAIYVGGLHREAFKQVTQESDEGSSGATAITQRSISVQMNFCN